ncbi:MAG TPA: NAD(P)H-dependent oxidoreductase, partial [Pseudolabrys sp.]|nr:NAD(P)H-dependent oxidoreductase [Pseudolabrys sp.]
MAVPKILIIPGSLRAGSSNARLAALAAKEFVLAEAEVTRISLEDYPLPLFDGDFAADALPPAAAQLKRTLLAHHGVLIICPEYNASVPPLIKNAIDWVTRVRDRGEPPNTMFKGRAFAIASVSRAVHGGIRGLMALRQILELGCGALVIPEQVAVAHEDQAFDERDNLRDEAAAAAL